MLVGEFWASIVIVLILTGGEALEDFTAGSAQRELKALLSRVPQIAHVFAESGELVDVPVAFMAGMSNASAHGVVVKNAGTLEVLARAKTVVFDKTGTLTNGTPEVVAIRPEGERSEEALLTLVAAAEQYSSRVLAASLVAKPKSAATHCPPLPMLAKLPRTEFRHISAPKLSP